METFQLVQKLGNFLFFGHDGIDTNFLKLILPHIANPLMHLINTSLSESEYANKWKISRTFPLLKEKKIDRLCPLSYGPVSLLPTISKIVLNPTCHAYSKSLSTTTTIAGITNKLYQATERKLISQMMTVNQSATFDCFSHEILIRKLKLYNIGDSALRWFQNYLRYCS